MTYQAPQYIANLQLDQAPADKDWKGIVNPLTVYDRIDATYNKYEYPNLTDHFDRISACGKQSLGASLFEWIINRIGREYEKDISNFHLVVEAFWAASIDTRYGGCHIPDLEYELIINMNERKKGDVNFVPSHWAAKGDIENILYISIAFVENLEDVITGPNEWLERLYYLTLYLMPNDVKPKFQDWFTIALERLEKYTPNQSTTGKYEDLFDEHWAENRGLPVPPQLLDPKYQYNPDDNTQLVNEFISKLNYEDHDYLNSPDEISEMFDFGGTPYTFAGVIVKEKKRVNINELVTKDEDLSSISTVPSIIKAASKQLAPLFAQQAEDEDDEDVADVWDILSDKYLYDQDNRLVVENSKLTRILETIGGKAAYGLTLSATEWIIHLVKDVVDTHQMELLVEALWAKMDINYTQTSEVEIDWGWDENDSSEISILEVAQDLVEDAGKGCSRVLDLLILAREIQADTSIYDAWVHNVITRLKADYPQGEATEQEDDKIDTTPIIDRSYFFNLDTIYNEQVAKENFNTFISKLDNNKNPFLPTPEHVHLMSYVRGCVNENPYNQNLQFSKEITAQSVSVLGNELMNLDNEPLGLKCFDIAEKIDPNDRFAYAYRGFHLYDKKKYEAAIDNLQKAINILPRPGTLYHLGASYYKLEDYAKAYDPLIRALELDETLRENSVYDSLAARFTNMAYEAIQTKDFHQVIEQASKALKLNPQSSTAYLNRSVGYFNIGDEVKSDADAQMARNIDPEGSVRTYVNDTVRLNKQGEYQKALDKGFVALQYIPQDDAENLCDTYQEIGYAYGELKIFDKALEYMSKAIELNASDALRFANRAYYLRTFGRFDEAINDYNEAVKILPDGWAAFIYDNRGKAYAGLGQYQNALADWQTAYNVSKDITEFIFLMYGHLCCGDVEQTTKMLKQAIEMESDITSDFDLLYYNLTRYALQIDMKKALAQCEKLIKKGEVSEDYPLDEFVKTAINNGHPEPETLTNIAKRINKVAVL